MQRAAMLLAVFLVPLGIFVYVLLHLLLEKMMLEREKRNSF